MVWPWEPLAVLLLVMPHPEIHAAVMGRQAIAEMPMLFYLLVCYVSFSACGRCRRCMLQWLPYSGVLPHYQGTRCPFGWYRFLVLLLAAAAGGNRRFAVQVIGIVFGSLVVAAMVRSTGARLEVGLLLYGAPKEGSLGSDRARVHLIL